MSITTLCPMPKFREFTNAGIPAAGYKLYTAQPGTVAGPSQSYPKSTYTDSTGGTANTNPVILDANGRANVWLLGSYSMALYDSTGSNLIYSEDFVSSSSTIAGTSAGTTFIFGDATSATYNANILAANDPNAPDIYEISKVDNSANPVRVTPATGTVMGLPYTDLTVQGEPLRIKKYIALNDWMKG